MRFEEIPLCAYRNLYRSISRYCSDLVGVSEIRYILYHSYLTNHESCVKAGVADVGNPVSSDEFMACLRKRAEPYRTPVQLCKSLRYMIAQSSKHSGCPASRRALGNLNYWIFALNEAFMEAHGSRIDDNQSTYRLCYWGLAPSADEPVDLLLRDIPDAYAGLRRKYLLEYRPEVHKSLLLSHRLAPHLEQVNRHALETRALLERCLLDMPSACGSAQMVIDHRYHLREKIEEILLKSIIFNDRMWDLSDLPIYH